MTIPGGWELVLVAVLIMVLFGYKKLPDATRSLGRSLRIFKAETKGLRDDSDTTADGATDAPTSAGSTTVTAHPIAPAQPVTPPQPPAAPGATDAEQVQHRQP